MITVSILYYPKPGDRFDFDHYKNIHMPKSIAALSVHPDYISVSVERCVAGTAPDEEARYLAGCFYRFKSIEGFLEAFMPMAGELQSDSVHYTNIEPDIQFNEQLIAG